MATTYTYVPYKTGTFRIINRSINYVADTIRVALLDSSYSPNVTTHAALSDVVAHEITGQADYSRQTLSSKTLVMDSNGDTSFRAANISFGNSVSISARYAVLYADLAGADTGKWLLGYIDLNEGGLGNIQSLNQVFELEISTAGFYIIRATAPP